MITNACETVVEIVERGRQGEKGERGTDGVVSEWDPTLTYFELNQKVSYLDNIYNLDTPPSDVGVPPLDNPLWSPLGGGTSDFEPIITNPQDKQVLRYDVAQDEWVNEYQEAITVDIISENFGSESYRATSNAQDTLEVASRTGGNRYHRDITNAGLFSPLSPSNLAATNFDYNLLGILQKTIPDDNINGSYHITFTQTGTVSVGDAVFIIDGTIEDGEEPEDNDCYCVKEIRGNGHIILNRPILTAAPPEYSDGFRIYTFTYETALASNNDFITFEGEGWVGYPFVNPTERMRYVVPNDAADADKFGTNTTWSFRARQNIPNFYGLEVDVDTQARPQVWSAGSSTNSITNSRFEYLVGQERFVVPPYTDTIISDEIVLENHPVQNVYIVSNHTAYDLSAYPNTYEIYNYNGASFDFVVIYGEVGENPRFGEELSQLVEMCHVEMNDSGVITSVVDTLWMFDNGGSEVKFNTVPNVVEGLELTPNGGNLPIEAVRYTLTDLNVITSFLEDIKFTFPTELTVNKLWPDLDHQVVNELSRDGLWYDESQPAGSRRVLIPFGSFTVDFLYCYENPNTTRQLYQVKGSRLYNATELVQGVTIPPLLDGQISLNGYLPVAALVQGDLGSLDFEKIVGLKNKVIGDDIQIVTQQWIEDLSQKTQFRTQNAAYDLFGYNVYVGDPNNGEPTGDPVSQDWVLQNIGTDSTILVTQDPLNSNDISLEIRDQNTGLRTEMYKDIAGIFVSNLFQNGGAMNTVVYPKDGINGSVSFGWGWSSDNDPTSPEYYQFPDDNNTPSPTQERIEYTGSDLLLRDGFYLEFVVENYDTSRNFAFCGHDTITGGFQGRFNDIGFVSPANNNLYQFGTLVAGRNRVVLQRTGNTINVTVNGTLMGSTSGSHVVDIPFNTFGAFNSSSGNFAHTYEIAIHTVFIREGTSLPLRQWRFDDVQQTLLEDGGDSTPWNIVNHDPDNWKSFGTVGAQIVSGQNNGDGTTTFELIRQAGNLSTTISEEGYFRVTALTRPSPNGDDFGNCDIRIVGPSGTSYAPANLQNVEWYSNNATRQNTFGISSGSTGNTELRTAYLKGCALEVYTDLGDINLNVEDFALNNIYNIEGERDFTVTLPDLETSNNSCVYLASFRETTGQVTIERGVNTDVLINGRSSVTLELPAGAQEIQIVSLNPTYTGTNQPYRTVIK